MGCCVAGPESQADEGALLSQLCSVLKDYEGLEEIDKMLGIPTLAGQVRLCRKEKLASATHQTQRQERRAGYPSSSVKTKIS